jgi:signal transduction histidine kinase
VPLAPEDGELIAAALEGQLTLLLGLSGATAVSAWAGQAGGAPRRVAHAGELDVGAPQTLAAVRAVLASEDAGLVSGPADPALVTGDADPGPVSGDATLGVRLGAVGRPAGALVAHGVASGSSDAGALLTAAAPTVAGLMEREVVADPAHWNESVTGALERRLARLRFDLHDGPQQDVVLLAQDVRLFREQLRPLLDGHTDQARALGRLDDLEAQLLALDRDLRRLSTSVQSPFLAPDSLLESLQGVTDAFAKRTGIVPETDFSADLRQLSDSQQIALLALIREALSNVRKHGDASTVKISIASDPEGIRAQVSDDGRGFDPETTGPRAARAGRLGLVGMHERVRMLGGQTQIQSRPGGPTVVSAVLPRWAAEDG